MLAQGILRSLAAWDRSLPACLLIRHGDRDPIPSGEFGEECRLTDVGTAKAERLGAILGAELCDARSSPLLRCRQTIDALARGAGRPLDLHPEALLGEPGAYVENGAQAGPLFLELGTQAVVQRLVDGAALPGIRSCEAGGRLLLNGLRAWLPTGPYCVACVSHDAIVIPFLHWITAGAFPTRDWLEPLDGGLLVGGPSCSFLWNGRAFALPAEVAPC
jgi:broad specificity phosphatase PhoE